MLAKKAGITVDPGRSDEKASKIMSRSGRPSKRRMILLLNNPGAKNAGEYLKGGE